MSPKRHFKTVIYAVILRFKVLLVCWCYLGNKTRLTLLKSQNNGIRNGSKDGVSPSSAQRVPHQPSFPGMQLRRESVEFGKSERAGNGSITGLPP
jgi:hypothetical protein